MDLQISVKNGHVDQILKRKRVSRRDQFQGITVGAWVELDKDADRYLQDAVFNTDLKEWADGVYEVEATGPKIDENLRHLSIRQVFKKDA